MTSFAEIVKAADALPAEQRRELARRLTDNLAHTEPRPNPCESWPVPPPDVPIEELRRIHALIEAEFSKVDPSGS